MVEFHRKQSRRVCREGGWVDGAGIGGEDGAGIGGEGAEQHVDVDNEEAEEDFVPQAHLEPADDGGGSAGDTGSSSPSSSISRSASSLLQSIMLVEDEQPVAFIALGNGSIAVEVRVAGSRKFRLLAFDMSTELLLAVHNHRQTIVTDPRDVSLVASGAQAGVVETRLQGAGQRKLVLCRSFLGPLRDPRGLQSVTIGGFTFSLCVLLSMLFEAIGREIGHRLAQVPGWRKGAANAIDKMHWVLAHASTCCDGVRDCVRDCAVEVLVPGKSAEQVTLLWETDVVPCAGFGLTMPEWGHTYLIVDIGETATDLAISHMHSCFPVHWVVWEHVSLPLGGRHVDKALEEHIRTVLGPLFPTWFPEESHVLAEVRRRIREAKHTEAGFSSTSAEIALHVPDVTDAELSSLVQTNAEHASSHITYSRGVLRLPRQIVELWVSAVLLQVAKDICAFLEKFLREHEAEPPETVVVVGGVAAFEDTGRILQHACDQLADRICFRCRIERAVCLHDAAPLLVRVADRPGSAVVEGAVEFCMDQLQASRSTLS